jgi:phospholipase D1/2
VEPEIISSAESPVTSFMRPAPIPNDATDVYDRGQNRQMDPAVIFDPLSNKFQKLWDDVAKKNRSVYTEVFRSIPNDAVKSWADYKASLYVSSVKILRLT